VTRNVLSLSVLLCAMACGEFETATPTPSAPQRGSIATVPTTGGGEPAAAAGRGAGGGGDGGAGGRGAAGGGAAAQAPAGPVVAGAGSAGTEAGGQDATGAAGADAPSEGEASSTDPGKGDGHDVITIGDSWMLLAPGLGIEVSLERSAMNDYRNYGVPGTRVDAIVQQYDAAKQADPEIATVVMTAGGNDILQDVSALFDCPMLGTTCRAIIDGVLQKIETLWDRMAADGVHDVVIIMYSRPPMDPLDLQPSLDYSAEITEKACAMAALRCTLVAASDVFGTRNYIGTDGIHPTEEGYDLLGDATYEAMVDTGVRR
jgi:lysophospholipase L1-like esterase